MSSLGSGGSPNPPSPLVAEWLRKAEADLELARREHSFAGRQNLDALGFLSQQAAEKIMKAILVDRGINPPKIHDLDVLDRLLVGVGVGPSASAADLSRLSIAGVQARYPGRSLSPGDATDLLRIAEAIWARLRPLV